MTSKPEQPVDQRLLDAHDLALAALREITSESSIGPAADYVVEGQDAVSLRFHTRLAGYPGWFWTVTLAVVEGSEPTVLEVELLPGDGALLAPEWVPWATRLADYQAAQAAAAADEDDDSDDDDVDDADDDDADDEDADADDDSDDEDDDADDDDDEDDEPRARLHAGDLDGVDIDELDEDAGASGDDDEDDDDSDEDDDDSDEDEDDDDSDEDDDADDEDEHERSY